MSTLLDKLRNNKQRRRRLRDIEPYKVDLVDRAANKRRFLVFKEETMPDNIGPELEVVDEGAAVVLDGALTALQNLTAAIEGLQGQLQKSEQNSELEEAIAAAEAAAKAILDKAEGTAGAVFREMAELSVSVANALESQEMDPGKLSAAVNKLQTLLGSLMEKYPSPKTAASEEEEESIEDTEKQSLLGTMRKIADLSSKLAEKIKTDGMMSDADVKKVKEMVDLLGGLLEKYPAPKQAEEPKEEEDKDKETCKSEELQPKEAAEGMAAVLHDVMEKSELIADFLADASKVGEAARLRISSLRDSLCGAIDRFPTPLAKSRKGFAQTLQEVAERALKLAQKAKATKGVSAKAVRDVQSIIALLDGIARKYSGLQKDEEGHLALDDLSLLLNTELRLSDLEELVAKEEEAPAEEAPAATDTPAADTAEESAATETVTTEESAAAAAAAEEAVTDSEPAAETTAEEETAKSDNPTAEKIEELQGTISRLESQISEMKSLITKARGEVAAPASREQNNDNERRVPLFPFNYNDPDYRRLRDETR